MLDLEPKFRKYTKKNQSKENKLNFETWKPDPKERQERAHNYSNGLKVD